jgi:hypothetical protein
VPESDVVFLAKLVLLSFAGGWLLRAGCRRRQATARCPQLQA